MTISLNSHMTKKLGDRPCDVLIHGEVLTCHATHCIAHSHILYSPMVIIVR